MSKNRNGTFKQLHVPNKIVPLYTCRCPEAGEHCPVHILDMYTCIYISNLPKEALADDIFFRPLENVPTDSMSPWYSGAQPIGKNTLEHKLSRMCALAGIEGRVTNHSLRATSATQMYEMGVPEKIIQERTGHRSLEALRVYERTKFNTHQQETASNILSDLQVKSVLMRLTECTIPKQLSQVLVPHSPFKDCLYSSEISMVAQLTRIIQVQTLNQLFHLLTSLKLSWRKSLLTSRTHNMLQV